MPSSPPTCLFSRPETTNASTSRSRGVSDAYALRSTRSSESWRTAVRLRSMAPPMASSSTSFVNGFVRNSTAPAFIACTVMGTSPWPVMKMIGMSVRSASCFCSSSPLSPGSVTSSTRQQGTVGRGRDRNANADANVSGCQPAALMNSSSDSRTEMSSSTTKTMDSASVAVTAGPALAVRMITSSQSFGERLEQRIVAEWFEQALCGPQRQQAWTDRWITVRGDEHNRNRLPAACQFLLQVGSGHADHRDVENEAAGLADELRREERLGR